MKASAHLITLGVKDLAASLAFYERFGWEKAPESVEGGVVFFQANGFVIGLYPQEHLSKDMGAGGEGDAPPHEPRPGGVSIGQNFHSVDDMRAGLARFNAAGGTTLREPFEAPWGLIAYAADIDGHVWEFAHVPGFEPNEENQFILPSERGA